jgi:hypothetical protein
MASTFRTRLARCWRFAKAWLVATFVCWHLFFLVVRNSLDLGRYQQRTWLQKRDWWTTVGPVYQPADRATENYSNFTGVRQGWSMFSPPLARSVEFLTVRLDFTDGSEEMVYSENEPDPTDFLRVGGWRQRRLEDYMADTRTDSLREHRERPLFESYVRWCIRRWQQAHPDDPRTLAGAVLLGRTFLLPKPEDDPHNIRASTVYPLGAFGPDGNLQ